MYSDFEKFDEFGMCFMIRYVPKWNSSDNVSCRPWYWFNGYPL